MMKFKRLLVGVALAMLAVAPPVFAATSMTSATVPAAEAYGDSQMATGMKIDIAAMRQCQESRTCAVPASDLDQMIAKKKGKKKSADAGFGSFSVAASSSYRMRQ